MYIQFYFDVDCFHFFLESIGIIMMFFLDFYYIHMSEWTLATLLTNRINL
jgi:hypothetical protein